MKRDGKDSLYADTTATTETVQLQILAYQKKNAEMMEFLFSKAKGENEIGKVTMNSIHKCS